jgi:hypothetical protein
MVCGLAGTFSGSELFIVQRVYPKASPEKKVATRFPCLDDHLARA